MKTELPRGGSSSLLHGPVVGIYFCIAVLIFGTVAVISFWIRKCRSNSRFPFWIMLNRPNKEDNSTRNHIANLLRTCVVLFWTVNTTGQSSTEEPAWTRKRSKTSKMFNLYSSMNRRGEGAEEKKETLTTGHDRFYQTERSRSSYRRNRKKRNVRRAKSAAEFDVNSIQAAKKRNLFSVRSMSSDPTESEQRSEKVPLVPLAVKFDSLAKLFHRSLTFENGGSGATTAATTTTVHSGLGGSRDLSSPSSRHNVRYHYVALDSGLAACDRSCRDPVERERAGVACQTWLQQCGDRYELISQLDDIGCRCNKNWFLLQDNGVRTNRLMSMLQLPVDCSALEELELSPSDSPRTILMDVLGTLKHPYIYPVLDLGFINAATHNYVALVMPSNAKGSLRDLIYGAKWNEPFVKKYSRKSVCLPVNQVQRLGRQILEALIFLKERGFMSHGHLHSGNVIIQNGVARLTGIENGLLGLTSRANAAVWAKTADEMDNIDVICFGHLLFEMCAGYELEEMCPTKGHLQLDLERYPAVIEILNMIFDYPEGYPTIEELVLHEFFRTIDLREMRGMGHSFAPALGNSTLLINAMRRRQGGPGSGSGSPGTNSMACNGINGGYCSAPGSGSISEGNSPCSTPPLTPRDRKLGVLFV